MTRFVSALRRAPHLRITGERQRLLASFAAVFLFGLLAHGYAFTNFTVSHDSLNEMFLSGDIRYAAGSVADWKISLGRFLYPAYRTVFSGGAGTPWLSGVLSLVWVSLAVYLVSRLFSVDNALLLAVIGALFVTNVSYSALAATYIYDLDGDMLAMLLAVCAAYLLLRGTLRRSRRGQYGAVCCRLQRVSGENGIGLAEHLVAGGLSAAEIVVIHARKIVVDQRIGMQHFDAAGRRQCRGAVSAGDLAELHEQQRSDALSSGKERIAHGVQKLLLRAVRREIRLQRGVDLILDGFIFAEMIHGHSFSDAKDVSTGAPSAPFCSFTTVCSASSSCFVQVRISSAPSVYSKRDSSSGASPFSSERTISSRRASICSKVFGFAVFRSAMVILLSVSISSFYR